ncbi:hypothetical protein QJS10_CPA01g00900 [Acorus calamus]|uniref:Uncharacterized protein n=1 Tax=Acorus calamus TaxID=4465 RepID=A0AAV9FJN7_ACOCL|nr:hypothetical protein QJS10_CPA01g00900 [Acorus calamus]
MGNCVDRHRSTMWADEEDDDDEGVDGTAVEQESLLGTTTETTTATELKIKITKRQLEEMLRRVEAQGVPLQNVIAQLLSSMKEGYGGVVGGGEGGNWRPALQSIPE